jgi:hypothetical protein
MLADAFAVSASIVKSDALNMTNGRPDFHPGCAGCLKKRLHSATEREVIHGSAT